jgi:hypothetical protein
MTLSTFLERPRRLSPTERLYRRDSRPRIPQSTTTPRSIGSGHRRRIAFRTIPERFDGQVLTTVEDHPTARVNERHPASGSRCPVRSILAVALLAVAAADPAFLTVPPVAVRVANLLGAVLLWTAATGLPR